MINGVVIHESASPQGRGDDAKTIHSWHLKRGFDGIGYHYVILEDGTVQNGRPLYWTGAHTIGYNHYTGICLIGEDGNFTDKQILTLVRLLRHLIAVEGLPPTKIIGHNQVSNKTCPGFDVQRFLKDIGLI